MARHLTGKSEVHTMKQNNAHKLVIGSLAATLLVAGPAWANDDAEATIRLMGAAEAMLPDAVMNTISLPSSAKPNEAAVGKLEQALAQAGPGNRPEQSRADEALQNANSSAQEARSNREDRGRSDEAPGRSDDRRGPPEDVPGRRDDPPGPPDDVPGRGRPDDLPGRPDDVPGRGRPDDLPGPPDSPPGRPGN